jgi:endonuclease/exonuclease/phosphatase (EEP) superfamily protein YafD
MTLPAGLPSLAGAVAGGGAGALLILADLLALDRRFPFVATVAWRPQSAVAAAALALGLATRRGLRPAAVSLGVVAVAGVALAAGRASAPGLARSAPDDMSILTFNALRGGADTRRLAEVITREEPDLVALTEAGSGFREGLMPHAADVGYRSWGSTGTGTRESRGVTLLASPRAGDLRVRIGEEMHYRHLHATGGLLGDRNLFAVHATAPRGRALTAAWRHDLAVVSRWCHADAAPIVVGDFNATLDHSVLRTALGGCRSAAAGTGHGLVGTYPASLPRRLGIQIDHVLVPAATRTTRFEVLDVAGSDHRAVLARLRLPAP